MAVKIQKPRGTMDIFPEDVALWHKIEEKARQLGISEEKAMLLQHMVLSHHGEPEYGACMRRIQSRVFDL